MEDIVSCPYCGSKEIDEVDGQLVCLSCGSVLDENAVSSNFDRRFFSAEEFYAKATAPAPTKHWDIKMRFVRPIVANEKPRRNFLLSSKDRSLKSLLDAIREFAEKAEANQVVEDEAIRIAKEFVAKKSTRIKNVKVYAVAILYLAFKSVGSPRQLSSLAELVASERGVHRARREIYRAVKHIKELVSLREAPPAQELEAYIHYFTNKLRLSPMCLRISLEVARRLKESGRVLGRNPATTAAAIVYHVAQVLGENRPASDVARLASMTETTLRTKSRKIAEILRRM